MTKKIFNNEKHKKLTNWTRLRCLEKVAKNKVKRSEPNGGLGRSARLARRFSLSFFLNRRAWSQATQSVLELEFSTTDKWNHLVVELVKLGTSELWILRHDHSCKLPLSYSYCCFSLLLLLLLLSLEVVFFVFLCYVNIVIITACVVVVFSFVCLFVVVFVQDSK